LASTVILALIGAALEKNFFVSLEKNKIKGISNKSKKVRKK
jgi:hypothetical protein